MVACGAGCLGAGRPCGHVLQVAVLKAGDLQIAASWSSWFCVALVPLDSGCLALGICVVELARCCSVCSQMADSQGCLQP